MIDKQIQPPGTKHNHAGHRSRMRERYQKFGLDGLTQSELLEMLLYYPVLQKDTVPQAEALLARFGSLLGVLTADRETLSADKDIHAGAKQYLLLWQDTFLFAIREMMCGTMLESLPSVKQIVRFLCMFDHVEHTYVILLSPKLEIIRAECIAAGTQQYTAVTVKTIRELADKYGSNLFFLVHSHPGQSGAPSPEDIAATHYFRADAAKYGLEMADHWIYGKDDVYSLRASGELFCDFSIPFSYELTEEEEIAGRRMHAIRKRKWTLTEKKRLADTAKTEDTVS